ncbi:MAG: hypothetical protein AVDCRST_MAG61-1284 [uncultured Friedmanniella sp.]|uniref:Mannitol-1-phosphate 5-dehydrogenase n=1 Tax=uncultured Friedmanniella sp. TaxID=335381 RepID=A0A6J4KHV5_9ACTN|nr:mannitol dehydrogenase family protein [uncultured Friedmanniella sp.]CAA9305277.1 MAG: hypothetical protein AVDCRST_MAG61-1284 [uncultured Friedmanniella sp.]
MAEFRPEVLSASTTAPLASSPWPPGRSAAQGGRPRSWALRDRNLSRLGARLDVPRYQRDQLSAGVVHLGVGNFHRAHQAVYFDDLARLGVTGWGITGVGLRSRRIQDVLPAQDLLYTVLEQGAADGQARVVGALHRYFYAPEQPARVIAALRRRKTQLVTMTVTGDGYPVDPTTGRFTDLDAEPGRTGREQPWTAFDFLVAGLDERRRRGHPGLTVLSCDNRADSAAAARAGVLAVAERLDPALGPWVERHVRFPDSMVDRITPAAKDRHRLLVEEQHGVRDRWPVVTEPFRQWVIQDDFAGARPPLDQVGVQFVADVGPHKLAKTRLLNGSHCALGLLGTVAGYHDTGTAMSDPLLRDYLGALMSREVAPLLPPVPGLDLVDYQHTLLTRFANPVLVDPLSRLAGRASTKMPSYLLPSLREAVAAGRPHELLALAVAGWLHCLRQPGGMGLADVRAEELQALAVSGGEDPRAVLGLVEVFGDLGRSTSLERTLRRQLRSLEQLGWRSTVAASLAATGTLSHCPQPGRPFRTRRRSDDAAS